MNDDWNGTPRFRKYPSFHAGQPTQIIRAACATVGLTTRELEVAVLHQDGELNWNDLSMTAWIVLCQALHLEIDCISYGYFPDFHRRKVGHALYEGTYALPVTDRLRRIRKWYRGFQKRERAREANYYGKRLLFRIRRQQFAQDLRMALRRWESGHQSDRVSPVFHDSERRWFLPGLVTSRQANERQLGQEL